VSQQDGKEYAGVGELRRAVSVEALVAAGVSRESWLQTALAPLIWLPTHRFAVLASEFDRRVAGHGLTAAVRWILPRFVQDVRAYGTEHIPTGGPLVVAANHPGSYDILLLLSAVARDDLRLPASNVPAIRKMRAMARHLIYTDYITPQGYDPHTRMAVARESVRHLRSGGALLVFATGRVEPDPALLPGAYDSLERWSSSLAFFLRQAPEARILPTIVSGVLSPACYHHPITRLRSGQREKQFLAEFVQISQQLLFGRRFGLVPEVRFAEPLSASDLEAGWDTRACLEAIRERARGLLDKVPAQS
jgi:hypothetical protein